ncbi:MAG: EAL domain-containing protein [Porticoccaceae bacterium]|nr:EAL domain-containing protein [Porticoccaceae bacterium]
MDRENDINLLLIHDNVDEANRLASLLRNANYRVHPQYAENAADLSRKVHERNWELALVEFASQAIPVKTVFHQIRRVNKDIPVLLISNSYDPGEIVEGLKMGAVDVIPMDADQHLIQVVERTLYDLEQRRRLRYWQRRFTESENRFENLLMNSQDGIAIIQEGTFVLTNDNYASFFGHPGHDSMVLTPVIDTIARQDQFEFKKYLKLLYEDNALDSKTIFFTGITASGEEISVRALLSQVDYHGDPALQLLIKKDFLTHPAPQARGGVTLADMVPKEDVAKIRVNDMVETINAAIRRTAKTGEDALLYYLQIDHYDNLQKKLGIRVTEEGIRQLAHYLRKHIDSDLSFGRIREDAFVLVGPGLEAEACLAYAHGLVNQVKTQMFDTGNGVFSCTLSIGISTISEVSTSADDCLAHCLKAIADIPTNTDNAANFYEPVFEMAAPDISASELITIGHQLISRNLIHLLYQPLIPLHGNSQPFYEVRMSINDEALSESWPEDFLHRLFATEVGRDLDRHVIGLALRSLAAQLREAPATQMALSLNEATITDPQFLPWLTALLHDTGIPATALLFQLREIDIGRNLTKAATLLSSLHKLGAQTALTHFGLAINPIAMLRKLSPDYAKIDGVLVEQTQKGAEALQNLTTLISDIKGEKIKIIVPHVETAAIIPALWQAGVNFIQGHYVSEPRRDMTYNFAEE